MGRYLTWSLIFHVAVLGTSLVLAPFGGLFGNAYRPVQIISVGLVDFPEPSRTQAIAMPKPAIPQPMGDDAIALAPEKDLTIAEVPDEAEPEPEPPEEETADPVEEEPDQGNGKNDEALAQADTVAGVSHSLSDGAAGGDIWGVETTPNVNPYHRRGFASIRNNWRNPLVGPTGRKCVVGFKVSRSGEITRIDLEQSSGSRIFDEAAMRAVRLTRTWDQFPGFWEEDEQVIHLEFEYRP